MEEKESKQNTKYETGNIKKTGVIIILTGLLALAVVVILNELSFAENSVFSILVSLISGLATTAVTIGAGTVLYSHFDFISHVKKEITNVIIEDAYLEGLDDQKQKRIKATIERNLIFNGIDAGENSLYDFVKNEVEKLVNDYYFEEYTVKIICSMQENVICKRIHKTMRISKLDKNQQDTVDVLASIRCMFKAQKEVPKESLIKIHKLYYDGRNITDQIEDHWIEIDDETYNIANMFRFKSGYSNRNFTIKDKEIVIEAVYTTCVQNDDNLYSQRVSKPCNSFEIDMYYSSDAMKIIAEPFSFLEITEDNHSKIRLYYDENLIHLKYNNWILPGNGVLFSIIEKRKSGL